MSDVCEGVKAMSETVSREDGRYPACKGANCGCTDGFSHSAECREEYEDAFNGVLGRCSVPMWMNGAPAGTCGQKSYGNRPHSPMWWNAAAGEMMRADLRYAGYVPGLACPAHGGPEPPNAELAAPHSK